jgi:ATP-dependent RNA helicase DDX3X
VSVTSNQYADVPVTVSGSHCPAPIAGKLSEEQDLLDPIVLRNVELSGYELTTPVQRYAIPIVSQGRDLMNYAQTGSGKTAAYLAPIISALHRNPPASDRSSSSEDPARRPAMARPRAVVLAPTRELASGIYSEACKFAKHGPLRVVLVVGGADTNKQLRDLERGVDVLVATPFRLVSLIEHARVSVTGVRHLVIDEADRILDMEFEEQVRRIAEREGMPGTGDRQTLLFAADDTSAKVQLLAADLLNADRILLHVGSISSD